VGGRSPRSVGNSGPGGGGAALGTVKTAAAREEPGAWTRSSDGSRDVSHLRTRALLVDCHMLACSLPGAAVLAAGWLGACLSMRFLLDGCSAPRRVLQPWAWIALRFLTAMPCGVRRSVRMALCSRWARIALHFLTALPRGVMRSAFIACSSRRCRKTGLRRVDDEPKQESGQSLLQCNPLSCTLVGIGSLSPLGGACAGVAATALDPWARACACSLSPLGGAWAGIAATALDPWLRACARSLSPLGGACAGIAATALDPWVRACACSLSPLGGACAGIAATALDPWVRACACSLSPLGGARVPDRGVLIRDSAEHVSAPILI
jgi:hypothetical protein